MLVARRSTSGAPSLGRTSSRSRRDTRSRLAPLCAQGLECIGIVLLAARKDQAGYIGHCAKILAARPWLDLLDLRDQTLELGGQRQQRFLAPAPGLAGSESPEIAQPDPLSTATRSPSVISRPSSARTAACSTSSSPWRRPSTVGCTSIGETFPSAPAVRPPTTSARDRPERHDRGLGAALVSSARIASRPEKCGSAGSVRRARRSPPPSSAAPGGACASRGGRQRSSDGGVFAGRPIRSRHSATYRLADRARTSADRQMEQGRFVVAVGLHRIATPAQIRVGSPHGRFWRAQSGRCYLALKIGEAYPSRGCQREGLGISSSERASRRDVRFWGFADGSGVRTLSGSGSPLGRPHQRPVVCDQIEPTPADPRDRSEALRLLPPRTPCVS
jgi:hypothetical protein